MKFLFKYSQKYNHLPRLCNIKKGTKYSKTKERPSEFYIHSRELSDVTASCVVAAVAAALLLLHMSRMAAGPSSNFSVRPLQ